MTGISRKINLNKLFASVLFKCPSVCTSCCSTGLYNKVQVHDEEMCSRLQHCGRQAKCFFPNVHEHRSNTKDWMWRTEKPRMSIIIIIQLHSHAIFVDVERAQLMERVVCDFTGCVESVLRLHWIWYWIADVGQTECLTQVSTHAMQKKTLL